MNIKKVFKRLIDIRSFDTLFKFKYFLIKLLINENLIKNKKVPVFIVGCPHSGTSLLLKILDSHKSFYAISRESRIAINNDVNQFSKWINIFKIQTIFENKSRWVEKTPRHILNIGFIKKYLPESKIIIIIRDGRDVAYSLKSKEKNSNIKDQINLWLEYNLKAKEYWNDENVYVIKYENIIQDFEKSIKSLMFFLEEEFDESMKTFYDSKSFWYDSKIRKINSPYNIKNHAQHRNWQINQPLFDGRGKWKNLNFEEQILVEKIGEPLLKEFGYLNDD